MALERFSVIGWHIGTGEVWSCRMALEKYGVTGWHWRSNTDTENTTA